MPARANLHRPREPVQFCPCPGRDHLRSVLDVLVLPGICFGARNARRSERRDQQSLPPSCVSWQYILSLRYFSYKPVLVLTRVESNAIHFIEHLNGVDCNPFTAIRIRWMDMDYFLKWMAIQWINGRQKYIEMYVNYQELYVPLANTRRVPSRVFSMDGLSGQ